MILRRLVGAIIITALFIIVFSCGDEITYKDVDIHNDTYIENPGISGPYETNNDKEENNRSKVCRINNKPKKCKNDGVL